MGRGAGQGWGGRCFLCVGPCGRQMCVVLFVVASFFFFCIFSRYAVCFGYVCVLLPFCITVSPSFSSSVGSFAFTGAVFPSRQRRVSGNSCATSSVSSCCTLVCAVLRRRVGAPTVHLLFCPFVVSSPLLGITVGLVLRFVFRISRYLPRWCLVVFRFDVSSCAGER